MKFGFTIQFIKQMGPLLLEFGPLIVAMITLISVLAIVVGRQEKWSLTDSLYYGFITGTTVGYGDYRPTTKTSKLLAVFIAMLGLILSGIMIAIAVEAAGQTLDALGNNVVTNQLREK